jgi:hypothetical protein
MYKVKLECSVPFHLFQFFYESVLAVEVIYVTCF